MSDARVPPRLTHEALVYSSDEEYLARLVPFLREGLAAGEPAIAVLTPAKGALLRDGLGQDAENVLFTDATTHYRRPARAIAEYRRHLDAELTRPNVGVVRVIGEVEFGRTAREHTEWTRYESVLNQAFAGYPAWIVCPYDTRVLPDHVVAGALHTHPVVSTGDRHGASAGYVDPDDLAGRPLRLETDAAREPFARLTVTGERDLDDLGRIVAGAARAAGLAPRVVDDVTVAMAELARDAIRDGGASVQVGRQGARLHCDVTAAANQGVGLAIARLIGDRVELRAAPGRRTVRLTFAGADDARQRLLDAASELFYQQGIRATGINTVIAQSGVAKATFFHHFPAKDDLVLTWLQQPASRWLDRIRGELDAGTEPPASRLLTFFDLLGDWFAQDDFRGCAFQNAAAETPDAAHPVRQATHDYALEVRDYLQRTANEAGLPDPVGAAEQLHLLTQGAIATAVATGSSGAARAARAGAERILAGLTL